MFLVLLNLLIKERAGNIRRSSAAVHHPTCLLLLSVIFTVHALRKLELEKNRRSLVVTFWNCLLPVLKLRIDVGFLLVMFFWLLQISLENSFHMIVGVLSNFENLTYLKAFISVTTNQCTTLSFFLCCVHVYQLFKLPCVLQFQVHVR